MNANALLLCPDDVDTDARGTFDSSARGRSREGWEPARLEPAWFVPREKSLPRLSRRLLSEASPASGSENKAKTYRLAAILDWQTGVVYLVSVFHANGLTRVTRFADGLASYQCARHRSVTLGAVLSVRLPDGRRRYEIIGSARTKASTEFHVQTFRSRREFYELFARPVQQSQGAVQAGAWTTQLMMEAARLEMGARYEECEFHEEPVCVVWDLEELAVDSEPCQDEQAHHLVGWQFESLRRPGRLDLNPDDVWLLLEWMPQFTTIDELVDLLDARHPDGRLVINDQLYELIERIAGADVSFFTLAEDCGLQQALRAYGY